MVTVSSTFFTVTKSAKQPVDESNLNTDKQLKHVLKYRTWKFFFINTKLDHLVKFAEYYTFKHDNIYTGNITIHIYITSRIKINVFLKDTIKYFVNMS